VDAADDVVTPSDPHQGHVVALRLPDDAMGDRFPEGSTVVISDIKSPEPADYVVGVLPNTQTACMRQLGELAGRKFLVPLNAAYPAIEVTPEFRLLGVVIAVILHFPAAKPDDRNPTPTRFSL
jgi:SOS-response transcriptional repressor LexA